MNTEDVLTPKMLSVCIVSFRSRDVLEVCLDSLYEHVPAWLKLEVIVVDNDSRDGSLQMVRAKFPDVIILENRYNAGFSKATNQGLSNAKGEYLLWLNPDTMILKESLEPLVRFLESHPEAGIVGPRLLNEDGSFQPQCRRGMPDPIAVFGYFTGLCRFFPKHAGLNGYLLTHMPENQSARVTAVSGAALLTRSVVRDQIGLLDERIFAYAEDLDWCVRASNAGWQVWYTADSSLVHLGGKGGSRTAPFTRIRAWHNGVWIFYQKHVAHQYNAVANGAIYAGIIASFIFSLSLNAIYIGFNKLYRALHPV